MFSRIKPQTLTTPPSSSSSLLFLSRFCRLFSSASNPENDAVRELFTIITTSPDPQTLRQSIREAQIPITNEVVDAVLRRVRFAHSNPISALEFYSFTSKKRGFFHSSYSFDTMLYVLGRSRKFDPLWGLLEETKRIDRSLMTPRTMQVVLGRIAKVCSVRKTVESFRRFRRLVAGEFGVDCYNALLRTLCQEKSMSDARNVYHALKREFTPNLQTFNVLLSGWKSSDEAEAFFEEMKEMGVEPDVVSYNCLVDAYCKAGEVGKAYKVIDEMRDRGIDLDVITYTSLIGGLGLIGQPDKAREVLKEMREYGCCPDVAAYNAVIRNFCIAKRLRDAYHLLDEMRERGLEPNATTYNVILRSLFWANDLKSSWSIYSTMKEAGCLPNTQSCMFLIRLLRRHERVDWALELWDDMMEKGFGSYTLVSDVLFDLLFVEGKLDEAEKCFLEMVEKGQKPSNVAFKRIKVLMELAKRGDAIANLSEKMAAAFGSSSAEVSSSSFVDDLDRPVSDFITC